MVPARAPNFRDTVVLADSEVFTGVDDHATLPAGPEKPLQFAFGGRITVWDPIDRHLEIGTRTFWGGTGRVGGPPGRGGHGDRHGARGAPERRGRSLDRDPRLMLVD